MYLKKILLGILLLIVLFIGIWYHIPIKTQDTIYPSTSFCPSRRSRRSGTSGSLRQSHFSLPPQPFQPSQPPQPSVEIIAAVPIRQNSIYSTNEVYVINLDERKDRMERIIADFGSTFTIYRTSAVNMTPPQQGCTNSFLRIVKMAKEKGLQTVLIFEDDNKPEKDFATNWKQVKAYLDSHLDTWEIFNGGQRYINSIKQTIPLNGVTLTKPTGGHSANWIYINSNAYDKLLAWESQGKPLIDLWLTGGHFNSWSCYPILGLQYNGYSNINKEERNFDNEDIQVREAYKNLVNNFKG